MDRSYVPTVSSGTCMAQRPRNLTRNCGTVRDNYGELLRSYDKNNDDRIDIDEVGDAGEDFAQGKISREQLEAVSFAFNNNCSVPPKSDPPGNKPPNADFTISPQTGTAPFSATFDANPSNDPDGSITDYFWEFPSGEQRKGKQIEKRFGKDDVGTVAVELAVLDNDGTSDITTKSVTVNSPGNKPPNADFTISPQTGTAPFSATFDANPSNDPDGSITDYFWEFPSGEQRKGKQIEKRFTEDDVGTVTVELTVLDDDADDDTTTKSVSVNPPETQPPVDVGDVDDELLAQAAILGVGIAPSVIY